MWPVIIKEGIVILIAGAMFIMGSINIGQNFKPNDIDATIYDEKIIELDIKYKNDESMAISVDTEDNYGTATFYIGFKKDGKIQTEFREDENEGITYKEKANIKYNNFNSWFKHLTKEQRSQYDKALKTIFIPDDEKEMNELKQLVKKIGKKE